MTALQNGDRNERGSRERREEIKLTVERSLIRDIVHQQNPHSATIISRGNSTETFLSCRVPLSNHPGQERESVSLAQKHVQTPESERESETEVGASVRFVV